MEGYGKEDKDFVPLNWESLSSDANVWEVIKEELDKLSADCKLTIITAAKGEGMKDAQIFKPVMKEVEVKYEELDDMDVFEDSTKD